MKGLAFVSLSLAVAGGALSLATPASAQESFRATCPSVRQRGPIIQAMCFNAFGQVVPSSIDTRYCGWSDIANANGQLTCRRPRRPPPPPGYYPPRPGWGY